MTSQATRINTSRAVLVLGMHRCGTSVLARALIALGVDFGSSHIAAQPENPKGFFEDKDVYNLNVSFLQSMDCSWRTIVLPTSYPIEPEKHFINQATTLLKKKFSTSPLWGLKEPRITRLLQLWDAVISNVTTNRLYLLANRNPFSVAASLAERNQMPALQAFALWAVHQLEGLQAIINNGGLVVDYDLMLSQPLTELQRMAAFLEQGIDLDEKNNFLCEFLNQNLRHSHHIETPHSRAPFINTCLDFHEHLMKLARSTEPLRKADATEASEVLNEMRRSIATHSDWFAAIDELIRQSEECRQEHHEKTSRQLKQKDNRIQKLQSEIEWLEKKWPVRLANKVKKIF